MRTPEFLVWAIERRCPLRQIAGFEDPERTERHLRTLRAYSDAVAQGRIFEGICVEADDPPKQIGPRGFRVEEALTLYGGVEAAAAACRDCPANAVNEANSDSLAGCFGMVPLPPSESELHAAVEEAIDRLGAWSEVQTAFATTTPLWYGLWMHSPLDADRSRLAADSLRASTISSDECRRAVGELVLGLTAAAQHSLPLHIRLYPRGEVEGTWWTLDPHCQDCHAPWPNAQRELCGVCGRVGRPANPHRRRARGSRPYWPVARMLGQQQGEEFLRRYSDWKNTKLKMIDR